MTKLIVFLFKPQLVDHLNFFLKKITQLLSPFKPNTSNDSNKEKFLNDKVSENIMNEEDQRIRNEMKQFLFDQLSKIPFK